MGHKRAESPLMQCVDKSEKKVEFQHMNLGGHNN